MHGHLFLLLRYISVRVREFTDFISTAPCVRDSLISLCILIQYTYDIKLTSGLTLSKTLQSTHPFQPSLCVLTMSKTILYSELNFNLKSKRKSILEFIAFSVRLHRQSTPSKTIRKVQILLILSCINSTFNSDSWHTFFGHMYVLFAPP
jgi:hypothetical protein